MSVLLLIKVLNVNLVLYSLPLNEHTRQCAQKKKRKYNGLILLYTHRSLVPSQRCSHGNDTGRERGCFIGTAAARRKELDGIDRKNRQWRCITIGQTSLSTWLSSLRKPKARAMSMHATPLVPVWSASSFFAPCYPFPFFIFSLFPLRS